MAPWFEPDFALALAEPRTAAVQSIRRGPPEASWDLLWPCPNVLNDSMYNPFHKTRNVLMWKGIMLSLLYQWSVYVCMYPQECLPSTFLRCPFCVMHGPVTPVFHSGPSLFPPASLASWCLLLHSWSWGTKQRRSQGKCHAFFIITETWRGEAKINVVKWAESMGRAELASGCLENLTSNMKLLVSHRTATIRWLKNLLMSLAAQKAEAVCWIHFCVSFITLYKPCEAF